MKDKLFTTILCGLFSVVIFTACAQKQHKTDVSTPEFFKPTSNAKATFGAGCFWCVEAQFGLLNGVDTVLSGYSGGNIDNPSYEQVSSGRTGHAEVIHVQYDSTKITYDELLEAFFTSHDPTQLNRQGNDVGPQYRSVIFAHSATQKQKSRYYINRLEDEEVYDRPIVTALEDFKVFFPAEDYHQQYYKNNKDAPYCSFMIQPKMKKFKKIFADKIKAVEK